jgi:hypothetical protein
VRVGQIAVDQPARQIRLVAKIANVLRLRQQRRQEPLDHAQGFHLTVARHRQIHRAHATCAQWLKQGIGPKFLRQSCFQAGAFYAPSPIQACFQFSPLAPPQIST